MANELYRTYEVLVEESIHPDHPKRAKDKTSKESKFNEEIDGALRDTHMIFQDAVCYNTLCFAGLAGLEVHQSDEREGELLNPLWKHLTTPAAQGGIKEETERMIRRLATHYKPLEGIKTADEFLNRVYSEPLQIRGDMTELQRAQVRQLRAQCYRILENGARDKKTGELSCESLSPFSNTWSGVICVGGDATIPGNLPYDRISRELKPKIENGKNDDEVNAIISETLLAYRTLAESESSTACEAAFRERLEELQEKVSEIDALPDTEKTKAKKLQKAKAKIEEHLAQKEKFQGNFFTELREALPKDGASATAKRFVSKEAKELELTEAEFIAVQAAAASVKPETKQFFRLREQKVGRTNAFEETMFRYWLLHDSEDQLVKKAAVREFRRFVERDTPEREPKMDDGTPILQMPFRDKAAVAFNFFGKTCLGILKPDSVRSSPHRELDVAAFKAAIEDVFKYKIHTDDRAKKVARLFNIVDAYEGSGLDTEHSPTKNPIRGMKDDPRWNSEEEKQKGIVQLLTGMSAEKKIGSYGLRAGTIGGWAEVRKALLAVHRKALNADGKGSDEAQLVISLEKAVDDEMEANRQGFGSADFFHELCDPVYFHLWLSGSEFEHGGIKDFIPHYVTYCEWREELISLLTKDGVELERETELSSAELKKLAKKPIRYTWPGLLNRHKKPSYRYYDFSENLNVALELKSLFHRVRPTDTPRGFPTYEPRKGDKAKLKLAARRLKRDKIINKDGNSMDSLWCPPLILEGESNPTAATKPKAGKEKKKATDPAEVSFSLIASPLPGDYWNEVAGVPSSNDKSPVHLTVSFKIEGDETAKLRAETKQWLAGSHRGFAKKGEKDADKRRYFNWPIDKETSKFEAEKPDEKPKQLWCGDGKDTSAWQGFALRRDKKATGAEGAVYYEKDFQILSIDLGNRFAAAFARLRIHADPNGDGRVISADGFSPVIKADMVRQGTLRLQGENAKVWQHVRGEGGVCKKDAGGNYLYALEDEEYGNQGRGRFPTDDEYATFSKLAARLVPVESLTLDGKKKETYPELGDHLGFRLKRRIGRLRTLLNLVWRLCGENERNQRTGKHDEARDEAAKLFHKRMTVETLARSKFPKRPRQPGEAEEPGDVSLRAALASDEQWQKLKDDGLLDSIKGAAEKKRRQDLENALKQPGIGNWEKLAEAVKGQIQDNFTGEDSLDRLLIAVIEFCLPLRGRHWGWERSRKARLHWDEKDDKHTPNIMGMRGLSMRRLDQILNLRQRCQSYAKLEDRYYGTSLEPGFKQENYNPPDSTRDERPDACPLLLERSNRIRKQRVNQAAHLILAEALGMELKSPEEVKDKKARKAEVDLHGEYKRRKDKHGKEYPRCSVIVLENLERYKMSQERTRSENSRLMQWAHRAIIEKLEDMCRPFGITLMLVDPAFSSHFDSRTGLPGVRVNEVPRSFEKQYPYAKWVNDKTKFGGETKLAKDIKKLAAQFEAHKDYSGKLALAVEGGTDFVPVLAPLGGKDTFNADIGAAGNIGLRAIADPQRWDIFSRLRTKKVSETEVRVTNWRGWFGKLPAEERLMRAAGVDAIGADVKSSTQTEARKKGKKKSAANPDGKNSGDNADSESGQSSEYPPYFVQHPQYEWLAENDLTKETFVFNQNGLKLHAYHQGAYLKKVEEKCALRITEINRARIEKSERGSDNIPM